MSLSLEKWHRQHPNSTPFYWSPQAKPALPGSHMPMTESLSAIIWSPKKRMIIKFKKKNDLYQPHRRHWLLSPKKRMIEWWSNGEQLLTLLRGLFFSKIGDFFPRCRFSFGQDHLLSPAPVLLQKVTNFSSTWVFDWRQKPFLKKAWIASTLWGLLFFPAKLCTGVGHNIRTPPHPQNNVEFLGQRAKYTHTRQSSLTPKPNIVFWGWGGSCAYIMAYPC